MARPEEARMRVKGLTYAVAPDGPAELGGVEGIYGVVSLPLRWSAG